MVDAKRHGDGTRSRIEDLERKMKRVIDWQVDTDGIGKKVS